MHNTSKSIQKREKMWHQQNKTQSNLCCLCLFALLSCFPSTCTTALKPFLLLWQNSKWQKISICKSENFWPFSNVKYFCHLRRWIWSKLVLIKRTCNLSVNYRTVNCFQLNFPNKWRETPFANGKRFLHLQMDLFCHFDFCLNKTNAFCCCLQDFFLLVGIFDILWLRVFLKISGLGLLIIKRELHESQYIFAVELVLLF